MPRGAPKGYTEMQFDEICEYIDDYIESNQTKPFYRFTRKQLEEVITGECYFSEALGLRLMQAYQEAQPPWARVTWSREKTTGGDEFNSNVSVIPAMLTLEREL